MVVDATTKTVLVASLAIAFGYIAYKRWKRAKIPTAWEKVGSVKKLHLYPLKSGRLIELERAEITKYFVQQVKDDKSAFPLRDRCLVVYGENDGEFRNARTHPKIVTVSVTPDEGNRLAINAPSMETLHVSIPDRATNRVVNVKCCQKEVIQGVDCGDEAAAWFSRYITGNESGLRLAYNDARKKRDITKAQAEVIAYYKNLSNESTGLFTDLTSVSLINVPSVDDLQKRVATSAITAEQFRHNIVVDGPEMVPYEEDSWDWIRIGEDVVLRNVKDCTRCVATIVNPESGVRHPQREPLKTLLTYRNHPGPERHSPLLGLNLGVERTGVIKVGDPVYVYRK